MTFGQLVKSSETWFHHITIWYDGKEQITIGREDLTSLYTKLKVLSWCVFDKGKIKITVKNY